MRRLLKTCRAFARVHAGRWYSALGEDALVGAAGLGLARALVGHDPDRGDLPTYAFITVRGAITDLIRQRRRPELLWEDVYGVDEPESVTSSGPSTEELLSVRRQLDRLPQRLRDTLWLRYALGFTVKEIARQQHRSRHSVHRDLRRGLGALRKALEEP